MSLKLLVTVGTKGGKGSGNWGHGGRPGKRGGSSPKGGGAFFANAALEEDGTNLDWKNEESVEGQIVITGITGNPSKDDTTKWLRENLETAQLQGADIEEIEYTKFEVGGDYVYAEVDIFPTEEAAESAYAFILGAEASGAYYS